MNLWALSCNFVAPENKSYGESVLSLSIYFGYTGEAFEARGVFAMFARHAGAPMISGIDSPIDCGRFAQRISGAGVCFVGRYYRSNASSWPKLTASEAKVLSAAGLQVVALWESASDRPSYFTYSHGVRDAAAAYAEALQVGQPTSTPIYFAVDFDASEAEIENQVAAYFEGLAAGFKAASRNGERFAIGVYGSGATCRWLRDKGLATKSWLALSTGWSGSHDFDDWDIRQSIGLSLGFDNDSNQAKDGFGGFQIQ